MNPKSAEVQMGARAALDLRHQCRLLLIIPAPGLFGQSATDCSGRPVIEHLYPAW